jgi:hypothetical protein
MERDDRRKRNLPMISAGHTVRLRQDEWEQLTALAKERGVTLSEAFRRGARMYLGADYTPPTYERGKPQK